MSLNVPETLLAQAAAGEVDDGAFVDCIRASLPYAWDVVSGLAARFDAGSAPLVVNELPPPDEHARGQLLRALASDSIRGALQRHFGVTIAFRNCHYTGVFAAVPDKRAYDEFVSPRAQVLSQHPDLRDC